MRRALAAICWMTSVAVFGLLVVIWTLTIREQGLHFAIEELLLDWPDNVITLGCLTTGVTLLGLGNSLPADPRLP